MDVQKWWFSLEAKIIEAAVFKDAQQTGSIRSTEVAPWITPCCQASKVFNTEHFKSHHLRSAIERKPTGCPKTLAQLIRMGEYDPLSPGSLPMEKLRQLCDVVQIPSKSSKVCYQHIIATLTVYI